MTDDDNVGKLVRTFHKTYKQIHGLVNCAGQSCAFPPCGSLDLRLTVCALVAGINLPLPLTHETPLDAFRQTIDVNLTGTFSFSSHYLQAVLSPNQREDAPRGGYSIV